MWKAEQSRKSSSLYALLKQPIAAPMVLAIKGLVYDLVSSSRVDILTSLSY